MTFEVTNPRKYGLALHTTTPELGLAINLVEENINISENLGIYSPRELDLGQDPQRIEMRSQVWHLQREVSNLLHQYLQEFLQPQTWQDLGLIAVACGPGGFTGTRIGVVAARTFGQQLKIPVFAISTLAAFAWQTSQQTSQQQYENPHKLMNIAVQMPAQRGQLFAAIYQINLQKQQITPLLSDTVFTPTVWQEYLNNLSDYHLIEASSGLAATVTSILELATLEYQQGKRPDWSQAMPFYGQNPV